MSKINSNNANSETNALSTYLAEIERIPLLSREEEYSLALRASKGDLFARNRIVEANLRFVVSVAKQFQNRGVALSDLINEGNIGLMTAVDKFDADKGYHFISYAVWWIRQAILKAIGDNGRMIRLPMNKAADLQQVQKTRNSLESKNGKDPSIEELAEACRMDKESVAELLNLSKDVSSLDAPLTTDEESSFGDFLESDMPKPDELVLEKSMKEKLSQSVGKLSDKEKGIIERRFGLNGRHAMSLKEIGEIYHLTKERIRQIEKKALITLGNDEDVQNLRTYLA